MANYKAILDFLKNNAGALAGGAAGLGLGGLGGAYVGGKFGKKTLGAILGATAGGAGGAYGGTLLDNKRMNDALMAQYPAQLQQIADAFNAQNAADKKKREERVAVSPHEGEERNLVRANRAAALENIKAKIQELWPRISAAYAATSTNPKNIPVVDFKTPEENNFKHTRTEETPETPDGSSAPEEVRGPGKGAAAGVDARAQHYEAIRRLYNRVTL